MQGCERAPTREGKSPQFRQVGFALKGERVKEGSLGRRTVDPARQALINETPLRVLDAALIIETVAKYFGLEPQVLVGKGRDKQTTLARHISVYLIREETGRSFAAIGRELGGRNHSAILRGYEKVAEQISASPQVRGDVLEIRELLSSLSSQGLRFLPGDR